MKWSGGLLLPALLRGNLVTAEESFRLRGASVHGHSSETQGTIARTFLGEDLTYTLSFLFLRKVGTFRISFEAHPEGNQQFMATVRGKTQGFIGLVTWFRSDLLTCRMEEVDEGKRLRPLELIDECVIGNRHRKTTTIFDYNRHQIVVTKEKGGKIRTKTVPLAEGETYYDPISGSYNFRFGAFGPIERGREYVIKTVPKKKFTAIRIRIASREEEQANRPPGSSSADKAYFITLQLDKEIMRSESGRIEGWLSSTIVPMEGKVRDVIFLGDVVGTLTNPE